MDQNQFQCPECNKGRNPKPQSYSELGNHQVRQLPCALCKGHQYVPEERLTRYFEIHGNGGFQALELYKQKLQESQEQEKNE
jgi:hypothetical protein